MQQKHNTKEGSEDKFGSASYVKNQIALNKERKSETEETKGILVSLGEDFYVSKLEDHCYALRNAMIDLSLKFPTINTFDRYLSKLKLRDNFIYIVNLLHECWCFAHPSYLLDAMQQDHGIDFSVKRLGHAPETIAASFDKHILPLKLDYYNRNLNESVLTANYGLYMKDLYHVTKNVCYKSFGLNLLEGFIISYKIPTDKTPDQLRKAFEVISKEFHCCDYSDDNIKVFLSMFDTTFTEPEGTIEWKDIGSSKNKMTSFASIYTLFSALGVDMSLGNKTIITKYIITKNGEIAPEQIKSRYKLPESKDSQPPTTSKSNEKQEKLRARIIDVIAASL